MPTKYEMIRYMFEEADKDAVLRKDGGADGERLHARRQCQKRPDTEDVQRNAVGADAPQLLVARRPCREDQPRFLPRAARSPECLIHALERALAPLLLLLATTAVAFSTETAAGRLVSCSTSSSESGGSHFSLSTLSASGAGVF